MTLLIRYTILKKENQCNPILSFHALLFKTFSSSAYCAHLSQLSEINVGANLDNRVTIHRLLILMRNRRSIEPSLALPRSFIIVLSLLRYTNRSDRYTDFRYFGQLHRLSQPTLIALISANYPKSASVLSWTKLRKLRILAERFSYLSLINQYCQTSKSLYPAQFHYCFIST